MIPAIGKLQELEAKGDLFRIQAKVDIAEGARLALNIRGVRVALTHNCFACNSNPVQLKQGLKTLDILVGRTSQEMFANDGEAAFARCFLPASDQLTVTRINSAVKLKDGKVIELKSTCGK